MGREPLDGGRLHIQGVAPRMGMERRERRLVAHKHPLAVGHRSFPVGSFLGDLLEPLDGGLHIQEVVHSLQNM